MKNALTSLVLTVELILSFGVLSRLAYGETITLTTYYPSPLGVYKELRAEKIGIGENYYDAKEYCWEGNCDTTIDEDADLVVEGKVGIGTVEPGAKLKASMSLANMLM